MKKTILISAFVLAFLSGTVKGENVLVVCDDVADPITLDPQRQFSEKNHTICQQIFEGLVRFDPQGAIEPALAVSWERMDPLRMRFALRQGVTFHNGEPFNAQAVRFSIERYLNPEIGFPAYGFIESLSHVEIIDEHTIDIVTKYPDGLLLNRLAGLIVIVPPKYVAQRGEDALAANPVGTGAFKFEAWERGKEIRLTANEDYWLEGHPKLDGLVFRFAPAEEQVKMLLRGEINLVTELPGTQTLLVETSGNTKVVKQRSFWTMAAPMRNTEGPLADVRVRRALNLAMNQQDLIRYDCLGNGFPLASLTVDGQFGHNPDLRPYEHNLELASKLLDEAGVKRPLVIRTMTRAQSERTARIVKAQLAQIGVILEIDAVVSDADAIQSIAKEKWELGFGGGPDPMCHAFFTQCLLLYSKSPYALLNDPEVDRRLIEIVGTLDLQKQEELCRELDRYVHEQALCLFTYQKIKTYGMSSNVSFEPYVSGMPYFYATSMNAAKEVVAEVGVDGDPASERSVAVPMP